MRRPSSSPVKTEDERISITLPKSCVEVKSERTQNSTAEKPLLLSKSAPDPLGPLDPHELCVTR